MYIDRFDALFNAVVINETDLQMRDRIFEILKQNCERITDYFNTVVNSSNEIKMAMYRYDDAERGDVIERIDERRRDRHKSLTVAINKTNRICDRYGVDRVFPTDREFDMEKSSDREEAAQLGWNFMHEYVIQHSVVRDQLLDGLDENVDRAMMEMQERSTHLPYPDFER